MKVKLLIIISLLMAFADAVIADPTINYFHFNNQSKQTIYVWVVQAVNVSGPNSAKPPYLALAIAPQTSNVKLGYEIDTWNDDTILTIAFCKIRARSCINSNGEYSSITIVPASETKWKVKPATSWSGMLLPEPPVWDNVSGHDGLSWNRNSDFPIEIHFFQGRQSKR